MESSSDAIAFVVVLCLPLVVWVLSRPPVWSRVSARLRPLGANVWRLLVVDDAPDEADLQRWAVDRLQRLRADLERVRVLLLDDEWMSATRQVGNRLAFERLVVDVRTAEADVLDAVAVEAPAAPTPLAAPRFAFVAPSSQPAVEMIEFGPSGRWLRAVAPTAGRGRSSPTCRAAPAHVQARGSTSWSSTSSTSCIKRWRSRGGAVPKVS